MIDILELQAERDALQEKLTDRETRMRAYEEERKQLISKIEHLEREQEAAKNENLAGTC